VKRTFLGLDLLRFALAVYLMAYHTLYVAPQGDDLPFRELLSLGGFATSTFFILSGFILAHVYLGEDPTNLLGGTRSFFVKRLTNLYPIHLISLALFLAVGLAGVSPINRYALMMLDGQPGGFDYLGPAATTLNVVLTVLMVHAWNPLYEAINPPSWSLSALLFFYVCFPWLAPRLLSLTDKARVLRLVWFLYLLAPVFFAMMEWYEPAAVGFIMTNPLIRLPEFVAGVLLYGLYREGALRWVTACTTRTVAALTFVVLCFFTASIIVAHGPIGWQYIIHNGALMPAELILVILCAASNVPRALSKLATRLGNAALSIFAIHLPLFLVFTKLEKLLAIGWTPLDCVRQSSACISASRDASAGLALYPLYLLVTVIAAVLFQERVVVPLRDALRIRLLRKTTRASRTTRFGEALRRAGQDFGRKPR
jgi:peptidoglycan/LPS O-acetylase OafA/YrhL